MSHRVDTVEDMWHIFDFLSYPLGRRLGFVVGLALLLWARFDPHGFIATATEWGRHQMPTIVHQFPTTPTTVKR